MDNDIDLQNLWRKQTANTPQIEKLFLTIDKIKRENLIKLIGLNALMIATIAFIIFIWFNFEAKLVTTKIGIILTVVGIIIYLFAFNNVILSFRQINKNQSNSEFLKGIINHKRRQKFLQNIMLQIYFIALTLGICLYLYEFVSQLSLPWTILAYTATLFWVGFNWFYLRPRTLKKENVKLDEIIKRFENIIRQNDEIK
jgi:hypothetical protein